MTVAGSEAISFLQGQLSQDITALPVGAAAWSFALQPQGKVDAWFRVHRTADDAVALDLDEGWGEMLVTRLNRFKLRTKCEIEFQDGVPTVAVRGVSLGDGLPCGWPGMEGSDHIGSHELPAGLPSDATELNAEAYQARRMMAGFPAMGSELTDSTIPAEAGQWVIDISVSFTKGCFTGQELVARIDSRGGNVPRHLRRFTSSEAPTPGADLVIDGLVVGTVTGSALSPDGDGTEGVGLAYVKRSVEPPAVAEAAGTTVTIA